MLINNLSFQALVLHDNVSFISLESPKPETVKIKIIARPDMKGLSSHSNIFLSMILIFSEDERNLAESYDEEL